MLLAKIRKEEESELLPDSKPRATASAVDAVRRSSGDSAGSVLAADGPGGRSVAFRFDGICYPTCNAGGPGQWRTAPPPSASGGRKRNGRRDDGERGGVVSS